MQKRENNQAKDARSAALTVLLRCERNGAWLDGALKNVLKESALEPRDAALCSKLCYGVCQNRLLLEFWLSKFSKVKPEKLEPAGADCAAPGYVPNYHAGQDTAPCGR